MHTLGFKMLVLNKFFLFACPHPNSNDWELTHGPNKSIMEFSSIQALYKLFKK